MAGRCKGGKGCLGLLYAQLGMEHTSCYQDCLHTCPARSVVVKGFEGGGVVRHEVAVVVEYVMQDAARTTAHTKQEEDLWPETPL